MPLTAEALTALVWADHLTLFPTAVNSVRSNTEAGIPSHNVAEAFIGALCTGFATSLRAATILDIGAGSAPGTPGIAPPTPFTFPGAPAAASLFLVTQGWTGAYAALAATSFINNVLLRSSQLGLLQMNPNALMSTGVGVVTPASNGHLFGYMKASLLTTLPVVFQATGKFCEGDTPGSPVNATLLAQLPAYAEALATGAATLASTVTYAGVPTVPPVPVAGIVNTGAVV